MQPKMRLCFFREFVPANSNHISCNLFILKVNVLVVSTYTFCLKNTPTPPTIVGELQ